jgi:hypothetical protein
LILRPASLAVDLGQIAVQNSFAMSLSNTAPPLVILVDVEVTLIQTAGTKRTPISGVAQHVAASAVEGATRCLRNSDPSKHLLQ